jgi:hypothetical protein
MPTTTITIEMLTLRVEALEKQITALTAYYDPVNKHKNTYDDEPSLSVLADIL